MLNSELDRAVFIARRTALRENNLLRELDQNASRDIFSSLDVNRIASIQYERRGNLPFIQPRGGYGLWDQQRALTIALDQAGADFIPLTIDSHTRQNDYERAALLLRQSEETGNDLLNGYPLLAHGATATRSIFDGIDRPISLRHGTPDARLLVEAALDAGISEIEGGGLCYCLPYSRIYPIDRALLNWQYVDRLCAEISAGDRVIHRESFGALTATMVPPFMVVVIQILELLLAAEQGVQSFAVSFSQSGSIVQDLATKIALQNLVNRALATHVQNSVRVRTVFHQWMGAFPSDRIRAEALIAQGAVIAALCDCDKVVIKTRTEALGIPDPQSNVDAVRMTKFAMQICAGERLGGDEVLEEADAITEAADHLLENIIGQGEMPLWDRVARAVRGGVIDIPYSPHQENLNQLWTLRDSNKAIRVANTGLVPLPKRFVDREKSKLKSRMDDGSLDRMLKDVMLMVRGA